MQLTPSQQEALNIERHVCVTAGAGSGKTTVLVERYLKILRKGNVRSPREIVAITYTEKAAAEMKERIIEELSDQETREGPERSDSLQGFREEMGSAHISTIHAFCSRILREFPFQAGVPANFSIIQGIDQKLLLQQTVKNTLKEIATDIEDRHRTELTRLLQRYGGQQKLVDFFSTMVNQRDVLAQLISEIYSNPDSTQIREGWEQQVREELTSTIDIADFIRCLKVALHVAKGKNAETVKGLTGRLEALPEQSPNAPEVLNLLKEMRDLITTKSGTIAKSDFLGRGTKTTGIETEIDLLVTTGKKIQAVPPIRIARPAEIDGNEDDGTQDVTDDDFLIATTRDLFTLYKRILSEYQNTKFSQGKLDFNDLQIKTCDLLENNAEIRQELVVRHKYYMIDEYQDTNELQYNLVMYLTNQLKNTNLFIVGDPKQSIYAFRGADVSIFEKTREKIVENGGLRIPLTENFRSLSTVIAFVNYFFNGLMGAKIANKFEVPYEALTKARPTHPDGSIEFLFGTKDEESADEAALIARHIKNMKLKEEKVWARKEKREGERSIAYGDIAILIRSRTHLPNIGHALLQA
ncbi:MAG: UvrD-helicase domain-containing protein, partial [Candidatus Poribacteria bacterium]|nr:UvrD-helicase domain-containing protein [Candidatus Poribacteria bacterium]